VRRGQEGKERVENREEGDGREVGWREQKEERGGRARLGYLCKAPPH